MKKINSLIILLFFTISLNSCAGYKPIFSSPFQFKIADYSIEGEKRLGNQIYLKLLNLTRTNENQDNLVEVNLKIKTSIKKNATIKDSTGKILEYKITLNSDVKVDNYLLEENILNHNFIMSSSYKVQDQYSETKKLEERTTENLVNKIYEELLIMLLEKME
tara:strand:+ start:52 stop:537 length:486 start_codon:yes stop_codon:yes gene_type:complete